MQTSGFLLEWLGMSNYKTNGSQNSAFIDGQNLYLGTTTATPAWKVDLVRFRTYIRKKYGVEKAYYFLGFVNDKEQDLYSALQEAGFIIMFREHNSAMIGTKKGNVDCDIVFAVMKKLLRKELVGNVVLVSGDGDYKKLVDFLIEEGRLAKILFPNTYRASSLYRSIKLKFGADLSDPGVRKKIAYKKKRAP